MRRVAWLTDIHLNFLEHPDIVELCRRVAAENPDVVLIAGDISEAPSLESHLNLLAEHLDRPIYFVLGNHDYYRSSIDAVRKRVSELSRTTRNLRWLPAAGVVPLTETTALVGHDCWGDGKLGSGEQSPIVMTDFLVIKDLLGLSTKRLFEKLAALGVEAAAHFRQCLPEALASHEHVLVLVHVPPFRESCFHEGEISLDDWLPFFTCEAVGQVLLEIMTAHPDRRMTVLCGHTHSAGIARILPNLEVRTGAAEYGRPELQEVLLVD